MQVDYIAHMGDDLTVVNAARVSFKKESLDLKDGDAKLIDYLAKHAHWTPFAHPQITLRVKAPVFIRTQCFKHKQGFVENEVSRRYVDDEPEFFIPEVWRGKPVNAKQGSDGVVDLYEVGLDSLPENVFETCRDLYHDLIGVGVAPEQARMVLPQAMYTEWYWTGSLAAYARFYKQRSDPHAQKEIQDLAEMVGKIIEPLFPVSWSALIA